MDGWSEGFEVGVEDGKVDGFEVSVKLAKPSGQQGRWIAQSKAASPWTTPLPNFSGSPLSNAVLYKQEVISSAEHLGHCLQKEDESKFLRYSSWCLKPRRNSFTDLPPHVCYRSSYHGRTLNQQWKGRSEQNNNIIGERKKSKRELTPYLSHSFCDNPLSKIRLPEDYKF